MSAPHDRARSAPRNNAGVQARPVQEHEAMTVADMKAFLIVAVFQQRDAPVRQDAVAVHQEQLDARGATFDVGDLVHVLKIIGPRRTLCPRVSNRSRSARGSKRRRSEEHTSELQSPCNLVCRLLLEKKK